MSEVVHQCPPDGSNIMPCCGRTPYEVPASDGIALRRYETLGGVIPNCQGEQVPYTPTTEEALYCSSCWADLKLYPPATELVFERNFTVNTETVRKVYRYVRTDATEFDRWLAEHDKKVIAKAFHEWADFQIDSLRVAPTTDEDYEEAKRYADAAKYWADNIILKGETE